MARVEKKAREREAGKPGRDSQRAWAMILLVIQIPIIEYEVVLYV